MTKTPMRFGSATALHRLSLFSNHLNCASTAGWSLSLAPPAGSRGAWPGERISSVTLPHSSLLSTPARTGRVCMEVTAEHLADDPRAVASTTAELFTAPVRCRIRQNDVSWRDTYSRGHAIYALIRLIYVYLSFVSDCRIYPYGTDSLILSINQNT